MSKPRDDRQKDLLLPALDQIIDMGHPLVRLAALIDWKFLDDRFGSVCGSGAAWPADAACRRPVHPEAYAQSLG